MAKGHSVTLLKVGKKRALYIGPSHAAGGIPVTIDGIRPVEVEGMEYKICGDAYRSSEMLSFTQKTNIEILDFIHSEFNCKFKQNEAAGTDFIICKLAVRDLKLHNRSGTVKEILDQMQGEVGCKLGDGSLPEPKMRRGGVMEEGFIERNPLWGSVKWQNWAEFERDFGDKLPVILKGQVNIGQGSSFDICDENEDIEEVALGKADLYDLSQVNCAYPYNCEEIIQRAQLLAGNTSHDLQVLQGLPVDASGNPMLFHDILKAIPNIVQAAKLLGYGGIFTFDTKDVPTSVFVWDLSKVIPIVINNPHNNKYFSANAPHMADGGELPAEIIQPEKGPLKYAARIEENLKHMGTKATDWAAVPVVGHQNIEVNGRTKEMPVFRFPDGYKSAPSIYTNAGQAIQDTCELCGKTPIRTFYWIQNDSKSWLLGVGSECIKNFQQESGKDMLRAAKVEEAKQFTYMLRQICLWIKVIGYKDAKAETLTQPKRLRQNISNWKTLLQDKAHPFVRNGGEGFFMWNIYNDLFPFQYQTEFDELLRIPVSRFDTELNKWVTMGPADPETCRVEAEKKLLSWYTRNKEKKVEIIKHLSEILKNQGEYAHKYNYPYYEQYGARGMQMNIELEKIAGKELSISNEQ